MKATTTEAPPKKKKKKKKKGQHVLGKGQKENTNNTNTNTSSSSHHHHHHHHYSAVFVKLLLPATTTTTTENNNNNNTNTNENCIVAGCGRRRRRRRRRQSSSSSNTNDDDDDDEMLTLAFARDENHNTNCNATTRVRINGDDEEGTKTVSLEKVARKRNQTTTKTTTMAFAAMDEIHVVFSTARSDDENDDESLVKALRFTVTNERNERVCEGTLKPPRGDATEKDAAVSIWASEDEEDEEDNENALLTMNERRRNKEGKIRVEISFVGESATLKAACEVAAKKLAPFERRVSSREYSPTPSERGGACSDKSVSWDECNVDRGDDFSSSAVDDDGFDDELNLSSSNEKEEKKPSTRNNSKLVSCLRELIPLEIPSAVSSSGNMILRKIEDSRTYAQDTSALIRAQYAELTKEWNYTKAKLNSSGEFISDDAEEEEEEEEDSIRGTNRALAAMQRITIVDDGIKNVVNGRGVSNSSSEHHAKELSWFSAGVRVGVGVGLGTCLGVGIGVGILVNGMVSGKDKIARIGTVVKSKVTGRS